MFHHAYVPANGLMLHVATAGEAGRPAVVLLHGFPESWLAWRKQAEALAAAGYFVLIPDQRGYNLSDKPRSTFAYQMNELAKDIIALLDAYDIPKANIVAHDWGGAVAWWLAADYAERVDHLLIINSPHPKAMGKALREAGNAQKQKSAYMLFFSWPLLPELLLKAFNFAAMRWALQSSSKAETFNAEDIAAYRQTWAKKGALQGMLNWYRALAKHRPVFPTASITAPTLILWGEKDAFFVPELAHWSAEHCTQAWVHLLPDATHWVHHEKPERVNQLMLDFFSNYDTPDAPSKIVPFSSD